MYIYIYIYTSKLQKHVFVLKERKYEQIELLYIHIHIFDIWIFEFVQNFKIMGAKLQIPNTQDIEVYGILTDTNYNLYKSIPSYSPTLPMPEDYIKGQYIRYFVVKTNQTIYTEVNKDTYDAIYTQNKAWVWENYIPFKINWYIKGDIDRVFNNNKGNIFLAEKEIKRPGLNDYLGKQYLQYFEYESAKELNTLGGELITFDGNDYIGQYHIHPKQGPMEGATHIKGVHQKLFYKRFYRGEIVNSLNQEGVIRTEETQRIEFINDLTVEPTQPMPPNISPSTGGGY